MFVSTEAGQEQQSYLTVKNFYQKLVYYLIIQSVIYYIY